jgi:hypothetical protein
MGKLRSTLPYLYEQLVLSTLNETYEINDYKNFLYFRIETQNLKNWRSDHTNEGRKN